MVLDDGGEDELNSGAADSDTVASQKDLSGIRIFADGNIGWLWDEPGFSAGANSLDACTYWNEGGDVATDNVIALCYSAELETGAGGGSIISESKVYECGDGYDIEKQKCLGTSIESTRYEATCDERPLTVVAIFSADDNKDFQVDCVLTPTDDAPPVDELRYLNTCSKTSASGSSFSDDCAFAGVGKSN